MNAFAPLEIRTAAPVTVAIRTDSRDKAIVTEYLRVKSLRKVAESLCVSRGTVSNALDRFAGSLSRGKTRV